MLSMQYYLIAMAESSSPNQTATIEATGSTLTWTATSTMSITIVVLLERDVLL